MNRAIDSARAMVAADNWGGAFSMCAAWPRLGEHKASIDRAASARLSPSLYKQMGRDLDKIERAGRAAISKLLTIPEDTP